MWGAPFLGCLGARFLRCLGARFLEYLKCRVVAKHFFEMFLYSGASFLRCLGARFVGFLVSRVLGCSVSEVLGCSFFGIPEMSGGRKTCFLDVLELGSLLFGVPGCFAGGALGF